MLPLCPQTRTPSNKHPLYLQVAITKVQQADMN